MKKADLKFKDSIRKGYSFIDQCLFKDSWEAGAEEYNKEVKSLIRQAKDTADFVEKYLANTNWKKEQCYQVMLKEYKYNSVWYYVREMFGDKCKKTFSDAGALKIGTKDFTLLIPNGYGDGETRYAVLEKSEYYANTIMHFFTTINGKFNVYSHDCGEEITEELTGKFQIYYYEGLVALVKIEED